MSELKIPNIHNRSRQFLFKNKLTIRRKSKRKLISESLLLFTSSFVLFFLWYLIPQKKILIYSFVNNIYNIYTNFLSFVKYFYQILLVFIIISTVLLAVIFFIGALYRVFKIFRRKSKKFNFK